MGANPTRPIGRSAGSKRDDEESGSLCQQVINAVTLSTNHGFWHCLAGRSKSYLPTSF